MLIVKIMLKALSIPIMLLVVVIGVVCALIACAVEVFLGWVQEELKRKG